MRIAIEGCVGAGKSTVAAGLARHRHSSLLMEAFESNPFLMDFYRDPDKYSLETEFAFLLIHYHQLKKELSEQTGETIADFTLDKDVLYADLNLQDPDLKHVFVSFHNLLARELIPPDLLICLQASDDLIVSRIKKRNRRAELLVSPTYYLSLNARYSDFFEAWRGPKIFIDMDTWDFENDPSLYARLSTLIDNTS